MRIKGAKTGRIFCSCYSIVSRGEVSSTNYGYSNKCLRLASEKFVLASESKLSLATGLAS